MRTKLLAAAALIAAGVTSAVAQSNVYSLNVVGYVNKVMLGGGKYTGIANPLNTTNNTLAGLLGVQNVGLPTGSQVLKWSAGAADFTTYGKVAFAPGWTGGGATATLNPGEGALVFINAPDYTNTFVGEVMQGNLTNSFQSGFQLAGNQVADSGLVSALGLVPPNGSQLLKWDGATQDWVTYGKLAFGWTPSEPSLGVGEGFMLSASSGFNWVRNFTVAP